MKFSNFSVVCLYDAANALVCFRHLSKRRGRKILVNRLLNWFIKESWIFSSDDFRTCRLFWPYTKKLLSLLKTTFLHSLYFFAHLYRFAFFITLVKSCFFTVFLAFRPTAMRGLIWKSFFFKFNASLVVRSLFYFVGVSSHHLLEWFSSYLHTSLSAFRSGMRNLFTISGHKLWNIAGRSQN